MLIYYASLQFTVTPTICRLLIDVDKSLIKLELEEDLQSKQPAGHPEIFYIGDDKCLSWTWIPAGGVDVFVLIAHVICIAVLIVNDGGWYYFYGFCIISEQIILRWHVHGVYDARGVWII